MESYLNGEKTFVKPHFPKRCATAANRVSLL
ncbi:DUF5951 family protein [Phytobacter sp. AG2a]